MLQEKVEKAIEKQARPYMQSHGGDVRVSRIEGDTVYIQLTGQCADCASADLTVGELLTEAIVGHVPGIRHVVQEPMDMGFYRHAMEFVKSLKEEDAK